MLSRAKFERKIYNSSWQIHLFISPKNLCSAVRNVSSVLCRLRHSNAANEHTFQLETKGGNGIGTRRYTTDTTDTVAAAQFYFQDDEMSDVRRQEEKKFEIGKDEKAKEEWKNF